MTYRAGSVICGGRQGKRNETTGADFLLAAWFLRHNGLI